jgi:hypothetical protein
MKYIANDVQLDKAEKMTVPLSAAQKPDFRGYIESSLLQL